MEDWIGRVLSKVRIERLIGRGGMADVYLGRHTTLNRPMAVKILHAHMTGDSDLRRRFRDEAQAVASLRHPNIVQVNDFDVADERPYIVMELLEGMALSDYLRGLHGLGHSLPLETVGRLNGSLTAALDYAHQRGIIHRDVKPANIILRAGDVPIDPGATLGSEVEPVLTDFGVARIATSTTPTASGTILGTPAYMSPEQVRGEAVDARSDIYSLGVILYEILAGKLPFDPKTDTPASILFKHVHEEPPALVGVSPAIRRVVDAALAKDPDDRYRRAGQMASDLIAAIAALPSAEAQELRHTQVQLAAAVEPTPWTGGRRAMRPIGIAAGLLLTFAVLAAGVLLGSRMVRQAAQTPGADAPSSAAVTDPGATEAGAPATSSPAASEAAGQAGPRGHAFVEGSSLELRMGDVPAPPEGETYHAWLVGDEGAEPLNLNRDGEVVWIGGELLISYSHPEGMELLERYQGLTISLESAGGLLFSPTQVVLRGRLAPEIVNLAQLALQVHGGSMLGQLTDLLSQQSLHFFSHAGFALDAIGNQDLTGAKQHTEHTINIIEGREGEFFGDWDNDGQAVNPGDPVGLLPYLRLLQAAALGAQQSEIARGRGGDTAVDIAQRAGALALGIEAARETARQTTLADSVGAIQDLRLDADLITARGLHAQIEQLASDAAALELSFAIALSAP